MRELKKYKSENLFLAERFKNLEGKLEKENLKKTISASGECTL